MPDPQAPFHPTEFADHASTQWVGLRLTPPFGPDVISPESIPLTRFAIRPPGHQPTDDDFRTDEPASDDDESTDVSAPTEVARWFRFGKR